MNSWYASGSIFMLLCFYSLGASAATPPSHPPTVCIDGSGCESGVPVGTGKKWNPGHYMDTDTIERLDPNDTRNVKEPRLRSIADTPFQGALIRYGWAVLEPERGQYDFSRIRLHRDVLASIGKRLIIQVQDRTFSNSIDWPPHLIPRYLIEDPIYEGGYHGPRSGKGGVAPKLHVPSVMDRQIALQAALAAEFDDDPYIEVFQFEETSLFNSGYEPPGYSHTAMRAQYERLADAMQSSWQNTTKLIQLNWFHGDNNVASLMDYFISRRLAIGGPDILKRSAGGKALIGEVDGEDRRDLVPTLYRVEWNTSSGNWSLDEIFHEYYNVNRQHYIAWPYKNSGSGLNWDADYFPYIVNNDPPVHRVRPSY